MPLEIERKFLLERSVPKLVEEEGVSVRSEVRIEQTYLALDDSQEIRVRRIADVETGEVTYTHTFKKGNGMTREEVEYGISEKIYEQLFRAARAVPLTKNRITAEWNGLTFEIDRYDQLGLTVVEVEFDSEEEANRFQAPEWFGRDIGDEKQYGNKTIWRKLQET